MAKQQKQRDRERAAKVGKGKVTPLQVAFIVERYLADNNYTNTLSAFRSDAADLFAKMKPKKNNGKVPSGLLGLGEILDEYITLKEQKLLLQQDRMRVDKAMHAFHSIFQSYYSSSGNVGPPPCSSTGTSGSPSSSPGLLPPLFVAPNPLQPHPVIMPPTSTSSPPAPSTTPGSLMNTSQTMAMTTPSASNAITNFSTPITNSSCPTVSHNKRKSARSVPDAVPFKKPCTAPSSAPSTSTIVSAASNMQEKMQLVNNSIAKSLFKPGQPISKSSPETPQPNKLIIPLENPSFNKPNSTCSIVSSERIIVSPLKGGAAYYSVERSYQFTSPLKPDGRRSGKRDHVKGKLNFDNTDNNVGPSETTIDSNNDKVSPSPSTYSPSSSGGEDENQVGDLLDFDLSEFDILNGDFSFSELLVDLDLDCEVQSSPEQTNTTPRLDSEAVEDELPHTVCLDSTKLPVLGSPDAPLQGPESVTSFRAITKRVKIVSPVKATRKQ